MPQLDQAADVKDAVVIRIAGEEIRIYENYEVAVSVLNQPAAFSLRLGWSKTVEALRQKFRPGLPFELLVGTVEPDGTRKLATIQSGRIDRRAIPAGDATILEVKGRDYLAQLYDSYVLEERAFSELTYLALTRKALDIVGLADRGLIAGNEANRKAVTGTTVASRSNTQLVAEVPTGATSGGGRLVYKTLKATLGSRWYDFLQQQYKLAGLFLWCTGDGNFVLGRPDAETEPAYKILRKRGSTRNYVNALSMEYQNDTTMRHSKAVVYGSSGGTKAGRKTIRGECIDEEMVAYGFDKPIVVHDPDVKTQDEADYVARRVIADERRQGWKLEYTVAGHTVPSRFAKNGVAVWGQDAVCHVEDDELEISTDFYIESVTFSRSPQTTTKISLMRKQDLIFAESEKEGGKQKKLKTKVA